MNLQAVVPPVHEIPHEYVACVRHLAPGLEQLLQVVELPVYVARNRGRRRHSANVAFLEKDVAYCLAQSLELVLWKVGAALDHLNPPIDVSAHHGERELPRSASVHSRGAAEPPVAGQPRGCRARD